MKNTILLNSIALMLCAVSFGQVIPLTGPIQDINTNFSFRLTDTQHSRIMFQSAWMSGIGDYLSLKHGGANTEENTFGLRISDGYGFDFGKNNFNTSFFKIKTNGYVGIGTSNPGVELDVRGRAQFHSLGNSNNFLHFDYATNGNKIRSYGTNLFLETRNNTEDIQFRTNNSAAFLMTIKGTGNVGIGTSNPDSKLTVKGKIHAEEVKIDLAVPAPDYVFKKDYELLTLEQVQEHIVEKGHLPNIPSAVILETEGVELGIMNMKLLEKIEELTLYTIQQQQEIKELKSIVEKLIQTNK